MESSSSVKSRSNKVSSVSRQSGKNRDMAEIFHWMLGKMNDQTIADYKMNPEQVVA